MGHFCVTICCQVLALKIAQSGHTAVTNERKQERTNRAHQKVVYYSAKREKIEQKHIKTEAGWKRTYIKVKNTIQENHYLLIKIKHQITY